MVKMCEHPLLVLTTHESFRYKGWLCLYCEQHVMNPKMTGAGFFAINDKAKQRMVLERKERKHGR